MAAPEAELEEILLCHFTIVDRTSIKFYDFDVNHPIEFIKDGAARLPTLRGDGVRPWLYGLVEFTIRPGNTLDTWTSIRYMNKNAHFSGPCIRWELLKRYGEGRVVYLDGGVQMIIQVDGLDQEFDYERRPR